MKNSVEQKPKRGTIGAEIAKLVKRYGNYTIGIYILESALKEATVGRESGQIVTVGTKLPSETTRYKELQSEEQEIIKRIEERSQR